MKKLHILLSAIISFQFAAAQVGVSDNTFGINGAKKVMVPHSGPFDDGYEVKRVSFLATNSQNVIFKNDLNRNGVQITFSGNSNNDDLLTVWKGITKVNDGLVDANNKIYCTGYTAKEDGNKAIYVARVVPDNTISGWNPDNTFNWDSQVIFDTRESNEEATAISVRGATVAIAGFSGEKAIVVTYTAAGQLNRSFNTDGFRTFQIGQNTRPTSIAIQPDNKVVVAGNCYNGSNYDFFVVRFNADGSFDTGFGDNGIILQDTNSHDNSGNAMVLATDGSIYIGGKAYTSGLSPYNISPNVTADAAVYKYDANGQSVSGFTNGALAGAMIISTGYVISGVGAAGQDEEVLAMAYDYVSNKIYCYGYQMHDTSGHMIGARYIVNLNSNPIFSPAEYANQTVDSRITFGGLKPSEMAAGGTLPQYLVLQYDNCTGGKANRYKYPTIAYPTTCEVDTNPLSLRDIKKADNGYYVMDSTNNLWRLNENHEVVEGFGISGRLPNVRAFAIAADGKIVCNLLQVGAPGQSLLARYNTDGIQDTDFGVFGDVPFTSLQSVSHIDITPENDYIVFISRFNTNGGYRMQAVKVKNDGSIDNSFGVSGVCELHPSQLYYSKNLPKDASGNYYILVSKDSFTIANQAAAICKMQPNGQLDLLFGTNGVIDLIAGGLTLTGQSSAIADLAMTNSMKFLVSTTGKLVQFNSNGSMDLGFGTGGTVTFTTALPNFIIGGVLTNGTDFFVGGNNSIGIANSTIIKLGSSGAVDTAFGTNGMFVDSNANSTYLLTGFEGMYFEAPGSIMMYAYDKMKKVN
ncbi:MAG TPA: delta-60 repeat domain-containing protein [Flavobacterium sp.]|jgi:uncharacterized delta-60 repeat protein